MPVVINGQNYYKTDEACKLAGISRATLFRWLDKVIIDQLYRDRRGWRLFTNEHITKLRDEANRVQV